LAGDDGRELRQVAMIDAKGRVAAHTGNRCIRPAGHIVDEKMQFSVEVNLMSNDRIWPAMAKAYQESKGDLADRLVVALEAAQEAGGDIRGRQSAAIVVVSGMQSGKPWLDRKFDLRVEDHQEPVAELKRLIKLQRAYLHMNAGDLAMEKNDVRKANEEYSAAEELAPSLVEIPFWRAVTLASGNRIDEALPIFKRVFERERVWVGLIPELSRDGMLPKDPAIIRRIQEQAPSK
ncbi:MAG TPA: DUF1028 domain-containing protein, partial [Phycisphaerae bacterium]|nr:DUF1028 domain-containing protein [Phycisphaerae bacterium]